MIIYYCDKCGKKTDNPQRLKTDKCFITQTATELNFGENYCFHLCDKCYKKFKDWLNEKE